VFGWARFFSMSSLARGEVSHGGGFGQFQHGTAGDQKVADFAAPPCKTAARTPETPESFRAEASDASAAMSDFTAARSPERIASKNALFSGITLTPLARGRPQAATIMRTKWVKRERNSSEQSTGRGRFLRRLVMAPAPPEVKFAMRFPGIYRGDGVSEVHNLFFGELRVHRGERFVGRMRC